MIFIAFSFEDSKLEMMLSSSVSIGSIFLRLEAGVSLESLIFITFFSVRLGCLAISSGLGIA